MPAVLRRRGRDSAALPKRAERCCISGRAPQTSKREPTKASLFSNVALPFMPWHHHDLSTRITPLFSREFARSANSSAGTTCYMAGAVCDAGSRNRRGLSSTNARGGYRPGEERARRSRNNGTQRRCKTKQRPSEAAVSRPPPTRLGAEPRTRAKCVARRTG